MTSSGISGSKILGRNRDCSHWIGAGLAPRGFEPSLVWRGAPARADEPPLAGKSSRRRDEFGPVGFLGELFLGELLLGELLLGVLLGALSGRESLSAISNNSFSS